MFDEHIPFLERVRIKEQFDTFTCRELALLMLGFNTLRTAAGASARALFLQLSDDLLHGLPRVLDFFDRLSARGFEISSTAAHIHKIAAL
ncbi:MAG TPA: hypothetical protein VM661_15905 [Candidatus Sulfotelmatobacter sp.]|nr:hypothetical protein [Candidatus Sulfotelmatobacter sp.]